jgi:hypothetical protein
MAIQVPEQLAEAVGKGLVDDLVEHGLELASNVLAHWKHLIRRLS